MGQRVNSNTNRNKVDALKRDLNKKAYCERYLKTMQEIVDLMVGFDFTFPDSADEIDSFVGKVVDATQKYYPEFGVNKRSDATLGDRLAKNYSDAITRIDELTAEKKGLYTAYEVKRLEDAKRYDDLYAHNQEILGEMRHRGDSITKLHAENEQIIKHNQEQNSQIHHLEKTIKRMDHEICQLRVAPMSRKIFVTESDHHVDALQSFVVGLGNLQHDSDCATHNMPAYVNGACDCGINGEGLGMARKDEVARSLLSVKKDKNPENLISFKDGSYKKVKFVSWKHSQWIHYAQENGKNLRVNPENVNYIEEI